MAQSPSHKFGQIIGDILEDTLFPILKKFCDKNLLYLDYKHDRPARPGKKVTWIDKYDNKHDLDFVFEKEGTENNKGLPVGFIECAWRRYTKHSRNKAQEIQSAILPLYDTYSNLKPFLGVVLAGIFTEGALSQLKSRGFSVLYFPYESIIKAFEKIGINSYFDEDTPDPDFIEKVEAFKNLDSAKYNKFKNELVKYNKLKINNFIEELTTHFERRIKEIIIFTLHGKSNSYRSISSAINFIKDYGIIADFSYHFIKFEIIIKYSNDDKIEAQFSDKKKAISFLKLIT